MDQRIQEFKDLLAVLLVESPTNNIKKLINLRNEVAEDPDYDSIRKELEDVIKDNIDIEKARIIYPDEKVNIDDEFLYFMENYLVEKAPPSGPARRFAEKEKVKREFRRRYGPKNWERIFYAVAWKLYSGGKKASLKKEQIDYIKNNIIKILDSK